MEILDEEIASNPVTRAAEREEILKNVETNTKVEKSFK